MTYHRSLAAAAIFLAATCLKIYLPGVVEDARPAVRELIDRESVALPLPQEAIQWLDWN